MAKFNKNPKSALGALTSDSIILTNWYGQTVASKKPPFKKRKRNSPKQEKSIDRFREAHHYADRVIASEEKKAIYEKGINPKRNSAHAVAFQDFLHPPVIHYIRALNVTGKVGDIITVKATDDFRVEAVAIEVFNPKGKLLEKGNAERYKRRPFIWKYKTKVANKNFIGSTVVVTAMDLAGNKTDMTEEVERKNRAINNGNP